MKDLSHLQRKYAQGTCPVCHGRFMMCNNKLCEECGGDGKLDLVAAVIPPTIKGLNRILVEDERG